MENNSNGAAQNGVNYNGVNQNVNLGKLPESEFDIKYLWAKFMGNWKWFAFSVGLCLAIAVLYILYGTPSFDINTTVLVNGDNANKINGGQSESDLLQKLGLFQSQPDANNVLWLIHSRSLVEQTIKDLQMNVSYWGQGDVRFAETYKKSPFFIKVLKLKNSLEYPLEWDIRIDGNKVHFTDLYTQYTFTKTWGDTIGSTRERNPNEVLTDAQKKEAKEDYEETHNETAFVLLQNPDVQPEKDPKHPLGLKIMTYGAAYVQYSENILALFPATNTTTINITLTTSQPQKGEDFLSYMLQLYIKSYIQANNAVADSTISFIDNRIKGVEAELSGVEAGLQSYKQSQSITDLTEFAKSLIGSSNESRQAVTSQQVAISNVQATLDYLNDPSHNNSSLPSAATINDGTYQTLQEKYNNLQLQRQQYVLTSTEANPQVKGIDAQLSQIRSSLIKALETYKTGLETNKAELEKRDVAFSGAIQKVPVQQRQFLEYQRRQDVLQSLYVYLLTVREQTAVAGYNNFGPIQIIDRPQAAVYPWWPNKIIVPLAAIFLGLLIPACSIFIKELLNNKIISPGDVVANTTAPVVAEISHTRSKNSIVVTKESRSPVAEQFRTLRTNLLFRMAKSNEKVILCSSGSSNEGKTFVSINLATAFALAGKKVLLIDFDLRKMQLTETLGLQDKTGIGDYLENHASFTGVVQPSGIDPNLWVVTAGISATNPSEILLSEKILQFFQEARNKFDFIILDTAPVAVVTDAQVIAPFADITLYVVRQKHTFKKHIEVIEDLRQNNKMRNINVILNDVQLVSGYNHGFGYGFRFDEGYDYYQEDETEKRSILQMIFKPVD